MKKIILLFCAALLLQGCRTALLYTSNTIPIPLLKEVRETQIAAEYGTNGVNVNVAASPMENFAFSLSSNSDNISQKSDIYLDGYKDERNFKYTEGAVGYYFQLDEKYISEVYTGYGRGTASDKFYEQTFLSSTVHAKSSSGKFDKYFVQANFGSRGKNLATGFAFRLSYSKFYELTRINDGVRTNPSKVESFFFEPAVFARFGGKNVLLEFQLLFPYAQKDIDFDYRNIIVSTGVRFIL